MDKIFLKRYLYFFSFIFLLNSFFFVSFGFTPNFEFSTTSYPSGDVDIIGRVSSGSAIDFYINNNYISRTDVFGEEVRVYLSGSIQDIPNLPIGTNLVLINNDSSRVYKINITGDDGEYKVLNYGDELDFKSFNPGDVLYKDEEEGVSKKITIVNTLVEFKIPNMGENLEDGNNELKFVISPIHSGDFTAFTEIREVSYNKYSVQIEAILSKNITNKREVNISGFISDSSYPLFYVVNIDGVIANSNVMEEITKNGNYFNFSLSNLIEGNNTIRIISTDKDNHNIFTGEKKLKVIVDTISPEINILSAKYKTNVDGLGIVDKNVDLSSAGFVNSNRLVLNISTDAVLLNYTFNDKNYSLEVKNNSVVVNLNLKLGKNNLTLIAIDEAGNMAKESHEIHFDNSKPDFARDEKGKLILSPEDLFKSGAVAHFPFQSIKGKLNKGDVKVTLITIPEGTKDDEGREVTCNNYKSLFIRNLGNIAHERTGSSSSSYTPDATQMSLLSLISQPVTFTTKSDGSFGGGGLLSGDNIVITLQEKDLTYSQSLTSENQVNKKENPKTGSVVSTNRICFFMEDKYGNTNLKSFDVKLDAGNTMWKVGEVSTIPNTLYAGEIESTGDERQGNGKVRFGVIVRLQYTGQGKVTQLNGLRVSNGRGADTKNAKIVSTEMNYKLDKNTGEMIVYFPVEINKLGIDPMKYPSSMEFWFEAMPTYSVDLSGVPIDDKNPIHIKVGVNIEKPLDHTKWLTPNTINSIQSFLNKSIDFTKKSVNVMGIASVAGVLSCTAAKFYYGALIGTTKDEEQKNEYKRSLFMICDRVACTASPEKCEGKLGSSIPVNNNELETTEFKNKDGDVLTKFNSVKLGKPCITDTGKPGVLISGDIESFSQDGGVAGYWKYEKSTKRYVSNVCVEADYDGVNTNGKITTKDLNKNKLKGVSLSSLPTVCFTPEAPKFDGTRCNFFGMEAEGAAGWNPSNNIFESIRCGCITDTYSHLKNYLKIQEGIYKCLEQAKVGDVKGSYCERLMGQAVCDIATNVVFKTLSKKSSRFGTDGEDTHENIFTKGLQGVKNGDKLLNDRYKGTFYSQAGLGTDQIVNKVCLAGITGDWSVLTDSILSQINKNEVEPIFGPMFPVSRIQGYNPLTGELSISYRFTYGVVSGGQTITTKVTFICDPGASDGEYCPNTYATSDDPNMESNIKSMRLFTPKDGSKQDTIVVTDNGARWRFNQIELSHSYNLKGKQETKTFKENILAKGELFSGCYFTGGVLGSGSGFHCDRLFSENSLVSAYTLNKQKTNMVSNIYYPNNNVFVNLGYDVRSNDEQKGFDLVYMAECRGVDNGKAVKVGYTSVNGVSGMGIKTIGLFKIPEIGMEKSEKSVVYSLDSSFWNSGNWEKYKDGKPKLRIRSVDKNKNVQFSFGTFNNLALLGVKTGYSGVTNGDYVDYDINFDDTNIKKDSTLEIVSNNDLQVSIVDGSGNDIIGLSSNNNKVVQDYVGFDKLQVGGCDLSLRILPLGKGREISTPKQFEEYDPLNQEDIATNIKQTDIANLKFSIANPDENNPDRIFTFEDLYDGSIICAKNGVLNGLNYIYETSTSKGVGDILRFNMNIRNGMSPKIDDISLNPKLDVNGNNLPQSIDGIKVGVIKGVTILDAELEYDVMKKVCDNDGNCKLVKVPGKSGRIKFKINTECDSMGEGNGDVVGNDVKELSHH